jgi:hypothetical protein
MFRSLLASRKAFVGDLALMAGGLSLFFLAVELAHPYFFLKDDNRTIVLPFVLHCYRGVKEWVFPLYNFHQLLGAPLVAYACVPVFVLPYLSVFLSEILAGHPFMAMEFLVFFRLLVGMIGTYVLFAHLLKERRCGLLAAFSWPWCGFVIYGSDSWSLISGVVASLPWMIYFGYRLMRTPRALWVLALAASHAALFHLFYPQYFVYAVGFEILILGGLLWADRVSWSAKEAGAVLLATALAVLLTVGLCLPALVPLWQQASESADRAAPLPYEVFSAVNLKPLDFLIGLINPFTGQNGLYEGPLWNWIGRITPTLSFAGFLTLPLFAWGAMAPFRGLTQSRVRRLTWVMVLGFFVALCLASGGFDRILYLLPVVNRFRWPFKYLLFVQFFLAAVAVIGFGEILKSNRLQEYRGRILAGALVFLQAATWVGFYALTPQRSFNFRDHQDELPLIEPLQQQLSQGRLLTLGTSDQDFYAASTLGFDYATYWKLYQFGGYALLVSSPQVRATLELQFNSAYDLNFFPYRYFRDWGVRWYLARKESGGKSSADFSKPALTQLGIKPVLEDAKRIVFEDTQALPLFYWRDSGSAAGITYRVKTNSIEISTVAESEGDLVVNFWANPRFRARIDGGREETIRMTKVGQILVRLPKGSHRLTIKYREPGLIQGTLWGAVVVSLALVGIYFSRRAWTVSCGAGMG